MIDKRIMKKTARFAWCGKLAEFPIFFKKPPCLRHGEIRLHRAEACRFRRPYCQDLRRLTAYALILCKEEKMDFAKDEYAKNF